MKIYSLSSRLSSMINTNAIRLSAVIVVSAVCSANAQSIDPTRSNYKRFVSGISFGAIRSTAKVQSNAANPYSLNSVLVLGKTGFEFGSFLGYTLGKNKTWLAKVQPMISMYNLVLEYDWKTYPQSTASVESTVFSLPLLLQKNFELSDKNTLYAMGGMRWSCNFSNDKAKTFELTEAGLPTRSNFWMAEAGIGFKHKLSKADIGLELHMNQSLTNTLIQQANHIYSQSLNTLRPTLFSLNLIVQI